jgi:hypothetical protein
MAKSTLDIQRATLKELQDKLKQPDIQREPTKSKILETVINQLKGEQGAVAPEFGLRFDMVII